MKIGFIGAGAMATAIAKGTVSAGRNGSDILVTAKHPDSAQALSEAIGAVAAESNERLAAEADIVVLSVKPHVQSAVIVEIRDTILSRDKVCVTSIAAGRSLESMAKDFGSDSVALVRVMPNVNAQIGLSMSGICHNDAAAPDQVDAVVDLFESVGRTTLLAEADFPAFAALAGCSPAWIFQIIDSLARAGVKYGLPKKQAAAIVSQALIGSATLAAQEGDEGGIPAQLIDRVTSPGGTTIAGLLAAEEAGLSVALTKAVDAAVARDQELG